MLTQIADLSSYEVVVENKEFLTVFEAYYSSMKNTDNFIFLRIKIELSKLLKKFLDK